MDILDLVITEPNTGCWLWGCKLHKDGYGYLVINGRTTMAHRFVYEYFFGKIGRKNIIHHKCCVKCCVNPRHLEEMSDLDHKSIKLSREPSNIFRRPRNSLRPPEWPRGEIYDMLSHKDAKGWLASVSSHEL